MLKKTFQSGNSKVILSFISSLLFIYIMLFEFILPVNKVLPKPSILIESIPSLFNEYKFFSAYLLTFSAIYSIMLISYFLIRLSINVFVAFSENFPGLKDLFVFGKYFIPLFLIFLFSLWFGDSLWGEYLFILIIIAGNLKAHTISEINLVRKEYVSSARSFELTRKDLIEKVLWKSIQPGIYESIVKVHIPIWSLALVYEFVCNTAGVGSVVKLALRYSDLSIIILLIAVIIITILLMELMLSNIRKKYFFWN